ncbi:hypothetical protein [Streptomyces lavenduligriseus]|uniref:Uncharacterized protein n=1 Tax=Streptomyces lavenduligriseus TaxID=67315 RepID=A0ABT0P5M9_9ACTN|nr:hypothetical protein [Streptomyces lavenduligriseus]MCL3999048.1 hypothetical protein [Streptomyces lavenduligriseus]
MAALGGAAVGAGATFAGGYLSRREDRRSRHVDAQRQALIDFLKAVRKLRAALLHGHEADEGVSAVSAAWLELSVVVPPAMREQAEALYATALQIDKVARIISEFQNVIDTIRRLDAEEMPPSPDPETGVLPWSRGAVAINALHIYMSYSSPTEEIRKALAPFERKLPPGIVEKLAKAAMKPDAARAALDSHGEDLTISLEKFENELNAWVNGRRNS